ncbi:MAG TPA: quinone oxidoreductase [Candidatus Dormibacteraeota bacterium]|nr:quinone oxidoreductase [Candidatus Dormibacteraeota bacterium]
MHAILIEQQGGPEVMQYVEAPQPEPGSGQILVRILAAGVNFIDIYQRSGLYKMALPFTPGMEACALVERVGPGVTGIAPGDRVAYADGLGSYAEYAVVRADRVVPVPAGIDDRAAAAAMLQGMTAHYLSHTTYPLKSGDVALVHAAAGGVGLLLTQMAKRRGARVIATVGNDEKAQLARDAGADHVIVYTREDVAPAVRRLTGGEGVHVAYDSVGKATWEQSLDSLRRRGMMVSYGNASGPVDPVAPMVLNAKGSLFLTRPKLADYTVTRAELLQRAGDVLGWIAKGELKMRIGGTYPLAQAAQAQQDLAARKTTGKLLLLPA